MYIYIHGGIERQREREKEMRKEGGRERYKRRGEGNTRAYMPMWKYRNILMVPWALIALRL